MKERIGTTQKGTCCITIAHRVGVIRKCIGFEEGENIDGKSLPKWEYKMVNRNLKEIDKYYIDEFFELDAELNSTFEKIGVQE